MTQDNDISAEEPHRPTGPALVGMARSIAVCAIVSIAPPVACAQEIDDPCLSVPECNLLVDRGQQLSKEGRLDEALLAYRAAYALYPVAWLHINMGRVEQKLGHLGTAKTEYEAYLQTPQTVPQPDHRERASRYLNEVEQELAKTPKPAAITPKNETQPLYKKWWLWTAIGGVVAVGAGLGLGLGLTAQTNPMPNGTPAINHGAW